MGRAAVRRDEVKHGVRKGFRRHHNNDGRAQIKAGATVEQMRALARRLGVKFT